MTPNGRSGHIFGLSVRFFEPSTHSHAHPEMAREALACFVFLQIVSKRSVCGCPRTKCHSHLSNYSMHFLCTYSSMGIFSLLVSSFVSCMLLTAEITPPSPTHLRNPNRIDHWVCKIEPSVKEWCKNMQFCITHFVLLTG